MKFAYLSELLGASLSREENLFSRSFVFSASNLVKTGLSNRKASSFLSTWNCSSVKINIQIEMKSFELVL